MVEPRNAKEIRFSLMVKPGTMKAQACHRMMGLAAISPTKIEMLMMLDTAEVAPAKLMLATTSGELAW